MFIGTLVYMTLLLEKRMACHDAGEYHEAGVDKDADVDVFKGLFFLR